MSKNLHTSFSAMAHLAEGLCFNALITMEAENSLICLAGTQQFNSILHFSVLHQQPNGRLEIQRKKQKITAINNL
jgi:hypothetical protein